MSNPKQPTNRDIVKVVENQGKIDVQVNFTDSSDKPRHFLLRDMVKAETKQYLASNDGMSHLGKAIATSNTFSSALAKSGKITLHGKDLAEFFKTKFGKEALKEAIVEISAALANDEEGSDGTEVAEDSKMPPKSEVYDPKDTLSLKSPSAAAASAAASASSNKVENKKTPPKKTPTAKASSSNKTSPTKKKAPSKRKAPPAKKASKGNVASKSTSTTPKRQSTDNPKPPASKKNKVDKASSSVREDFDNEVPVPIVAHVSHLMHWDTILAKKILESTGSDMKKDCRTEFFELCYYCHGRFGRFRHKEAIQLYFEDWCAAQKNITREEQAVLDSLKKSHITERATANVKLYAKEIGATRNEFKKTP